MGRAFLGLGSNLGDKEIFLREAVATFDDLKAISGIYETDPVGGPEQDSYLNIVIELDTNLGARELLNLAQMLERRANRKREIRWGPRTLDVDVLWVEGEEVDEDVDLDEVLKALSEEEDLEEEKDEVAELDEPDLTVPHPRMRERAFVMIPLGELEPTFLHGWEDPNDGEVRRLRDW